MLALGTIVAISIMFWTPHTVFAQNKSDDVTNTSETTLYEFELGSAKFEFDISISNGHTASFYKGAEKRSAVICLDSGGPLVLNAEYDTSASLDASLAKPALASLDISSKSCAFLESLVGLSANVPVDGEPAIGIVSIFNTENVPKFPTNRFPNASNDFPISIDPGGKTNIYKGSKSRSIAICTELGGPLGLEVEYKTIARPASESLNIAGLSCTFLESAVGLKVELPTSVEKVEGYVVIYDTNKLVPFPQQSDGVIRQFSVSIPQNISVDIYKGKEPRSIIVCQNNGKTMELTAEFDTSPSVDDGSVAILNLVASSCATVDQVTRLKLKENAGSAAAIGEVILLDRANSFPKDPD